MDPLLRKICQDMFRDSSSFHFKENKGTKDDGSGTTQRETELLEINKRLLSKDHHHIKNINASKYNYLQMKSKILNQSERIKLLEDAHNRYKTETALYIKKLEKQVKKLKKINKIISEERVKTPYACYETIFNLYEQIQQGN